MFKVMLPSVAFKEGPRELFKDPFSHRRVTQLLLPRSERAPGPAHRPVFHFSRRLGSERPHGASMTRGNAWVLAGGGAPGRGTCPLLRIKSGPMVGHVGGWKARPRVPKAFRCPAALSLGGGL